MPTDPEFAFSLAADSGIPLDPSMSISDESFERFRQEYSRLAGQRDAELRASLLSSQGQLRAHIPFSERTYSRALETSWFFDEMIVRDPVAVSLARAPRLSQADAKEDLRTTLAHLSVARPALRAGYMRLFGPDLLPLTSDTQLEVDDRDVVNRLMTRQDVRDALRAGARYGCGSVTLPDGQTCRLYTVSYDSGGMCGILDQIRIEPAGQVILMIVRNGLPEISRAELLGLVRGDVDEAMQRLFEREIFAGLTAAENAQRLGCALVSDKPHTGTILAAAGGRAVDPSTQLAADAFELVVPYLRGVSCERLMALRGSEPLAFRDFRYELLAALEQAQRESPADATRRAREVLARRAVPNLRVLTNEMGAWAAKAGLLAGTVPAVVLAGSFFAASFQQPTMVAASVLSASLAALAAASSLATERGKMMSNPFYFFWKARQP